MSYDFRLDAICPHQVVFEELGLVDYQYLHPISPISTSKVKVFVNEMEVPKEGLHSRAHSFFTHTGFSSIVSGTNDVIKLAVDSGSEQTIILESGVLTIEQIAQDLKNKVSNVDIEVSKGYLSITSKTYGSGSKLIWGDGTAHSTLGVPVDRIYTGKELYPGWDLVVDENSVGLRMVSFNSPFMSSDNIIEMTYFTSSQYCRRCQGLKIENDFRFDTLGRKIKVRDENLLQQEINKILLTIKKSNLFHPWYGTRLSSLPGSKYIDFIKSEILSEVKSALDNMRDIKLQQARLQEVTPGEFPESLSVTKFSQPDNDPTILDLEIDVLSRQGRKVTINQLIRLPKPEVINQLPQGFSRRG